MSTKLKNLRMKVHADSVKFVRTAAVEAAKLSPYATGENAANIYTVVNHERVKHKPLKARISRQAAINRTRNRARKWNPREDARFLGLVATAPYSKLLEKGSSKQAPTGFMRNGIKRAAAKVFR